MQSTRVDERVLIAGAALRFALLVVLFASTSVTVMSDSLSALRHYPDSKAIGCTLAAGMNSDGSANPGPGLPQVAAPCGEGPLSCWS
ncbi:hypothetical protein P3T37_000148 [Kitasatospora sp. MAA4]|nr:hypothetical protein [Kitasatospora sp. MAA4]